MARTHVIFSDEVMHQIDALVGPRGRSRFLEEAAREKLQRLALEESLQQTSGVLKEGPWVDRASAREWVRATRRTESGSPPV